MNAHPRRVVFRTDASASIGGGHVMRCLALAETLRREGAECWFASTSESFKTVPALGKSGHRHVELGSPDHADTLRRAIPEGCDWLVVDHYCWGVAQETLCRPWATKILVIDDLANRAHDCDLLLDQTIGRAGADYRNLVHPGGDLLVGSHYALLRPEFVEWRPRSLARRKAAALRRVLVCMGLSDPANLSSTIVEGIVESKLPLTVDVVLGPSAPALSAVREMIARHARTFTLHVGTDGMAKLLSECDLCFGAAGSSAWERCCLGVPSVIAVIAENQREVAERLVAAGAALSIGFAAQVTPAAVAQAIRAFARDGTLATKLSGEAVTICDGRGAERVAMRLQPARASNGKPIWLRPAIPSDVEITYALQAQPETRKFGRNSAVPTPAEHQQWFSARLRNAASYLSIIVLDGADVGTLRLDRIDQNVYEISIVVSNQYYGHGVGFCALELARRLVPEARVRAEILPGNVRSEALFTRAGYLPPGYGWRSIGPLSPSSPETANIREA